MEDYKNKDYIENANKEQLQARIRYIKEKKMEVCDKIIRCMDIRDESKRQIEKRRKQVENLEDITSRDYEIIEEQDKKMVEKRKIMYNLENDLEETNLALDNIILNEKRPEE